MRISDWSSDVCSSDLVLRQSEIGVDLGPGYEGDLVVNGQPIPEEELRRVPEQNQVFYLPGKGTTFEELPGGTNCVTAIARSEERRVGQECVRTCRSRWST